MRRCLHQPPVVFSLHWILGFLDFRFNVRRGLKPRARSNLLKLVGGSIELIWDCNLLALVVGWMYPEQGTVFCTLVP
ncbi:unnamed protein product [Citrullus colocynthis]|uniref:Uncharacterized protein n=1 Tax=Citrullus colocynthis TaxID=252529 RepID=A0ABP0YG70_9ROSI